MHKKTNKEFRTQVYRLVGDDYTFLEPYKNAREPIMVRHNYCGAEYDGEQHFHPIAYFGGMKKFEYTHYRDSFKNKFCKEHHIRLIRIKYTEDVNKVLEQVL